MSKFGRTTAFMSAAGYSSAFANEFTGPLNPFPGLGIGELFARYVHCDERRKIKVYHSDRVGLLLSDGLFAWAVSIGIGINTNVSTTAAAPKLFKG